MTITSDEIKQLKASFAVDTHSVREGPGNEDKTKCMWFVYLDRFAIIERLDDLFPGEWEYTMSEPQLRESHYSATGRLTIRGVVREFNGTQAVSDPNKDEKGCGTDTFRRVASMWGIGAYLYKTPNVWTAKPGKYDWDAQKAAKAEVLKRLGNWLNREYGQNNQPPQSSNGNSSQLEEPQPAESKWATKNTVMPIMKKFRAQGLSDTEIFELAGVTAFNDPVWNNRANAAEAIATIEGNFTAHLESLERGDGPLVGTDTPSDTDNGRPAVYSCRFTHKAYEVIGKKTCLKFANCNPMNGANEGNLVIANVYDRSKGFRAMIGDDVYDALGLADYDSADKTIPFTQIPPPLDCIELEYVEKTIQKGKSKGEVYNEIIGVVGNDTYEIDPPF